MKSGAYLALPAPLGVYNRLEPHPYQADFQTSLRAEIHDALWMLTRQWQYGEFQGEDTGTAIWADVEMDCTRLTRFAYEGQQPSLLLKTGPGNTVVEALPPEALAEAEPVPFNWKTHLQWSLAWRRLLTANGCPAVTYERFVQTFPLRVGTAKAELEAYNADPEQQQWLKILGGKVLDARLFYADLNTKPNASALLQPALTDTALQGNVNTAGVQMKAWCQNLFCQPTVPSTLPPAPPQGWKANSLRYSFGLGALKTPTTREAYVADHALGHLDWYNFDTVPGGSTLFPNLAAPANQAGEPVNTFYNDSLRFIANPAQFPGMPASRYWEFENGRINLANLDVDASDLAKVLLAEFALVYSNDWQLLPYTLPYGSVCRIKKISVSTVFDENYVPIPALNTTNRDWCFFNLNQQGSTSAVPQDACLLLPQVIADLQEGKPIEHVRFVSSEMDNLLWAVEELIPDFLGEGASAKALFKRLKDYLQGAIPANIVQPPAEFWYKLMQEIPEFQIPYLPEGTDKFKQYQLRRHLAGVNDAAIVAPRGLYLNQSAAQPIEGAQVPAASLSVLRTFQRTRWLDGRVVTWLGRKTVKGRPGTVAPLVFDQLIRSGEKL